MHDSIFTKIINGEIPSHKVYEDNKTFAFLDIYPVQPGHVLVVPKKQIEFVWDLSEDDYQALLYATRLVALRIREVLPVKHVGQKIFGLDVPHAHVHLIPFNKPDEFIKAQDMSIEPDHQALAEMAAKLAF